VRGEILQKKRDVGEERKKTNKSKGRPWPFPLVQVSGL
jgi:hypothetical protein